MIDFEPRTIPDNNTRQARLVDSEGKLYQEDYTSSKSELLLEEICRSFGTELGQALLNPLNGPKLVAVSKPAVLTHRDNGQKTLLMAQHTRFCPYTPAYRRRILSLYPEKSEIQNAVASQLEHDLRSEESPFTLVTDPNLLLYVNIHRWPKQVYFSVFDVNPTEALSDPIGPFSIHEGRSFKNRAARVHICLDIPPFFANGFSRENISSIFDTIYFNFPQITSEHDLALNGALKLSPLYEMEQIKRQVEYADEPLPNRDPYNLYHILGGYLELPSDFPREITLGFIQTYLRKMCLGGMLS